MFYLIFTALYLAIPLIVAGSLHMLIVSKNWCSSLAVPIELESFGANKTWRGIIVMVVATIPGVYLARYMGLYLGDSVLISLQQSNPIWLGAALGLGYVIPELPNSYVKRRLNIKPGERTDKNVALFAFIDQADSAIGCALVYWLMLSPPLGVIIWIVLLGPLVHLIANVTLYSLGLRKHPI